MFYRVIFLLIIVIQIGIIVSITNKIKNDKKNVQGEVVINPIKKVDTIHINSELTYFYEPKPNEIIIDESPFPATYTINTDSLNERYDYQIEKSQNVFRIITLGDSFTYGLYVNTEENWTELIEDQLNNLACQNKKKYEVINLGSHGYDIQYSVERYKNRGTKYDPDLVIWLLKEDDVFHINEIIIDKEKDHRNRLKKTGDYQKAVEKGNLYLSWEVAMEDMVNQYGQDQIFSIQGQFLETFRDLYHNKLLAVSFEHESEDVKQFIHDFKIKDKNTYYFDNLKTLYDNDALNFKNDHHPTVEGHKVIAIEMMNYLVDNNLVQCN